MKKILFVAAACVALASCSKEEIVSVDKGAAIGFDTFVENSTRANDITKTNLSQFSVYGSVVANGSEGFIFEDQTVTKSGDAYTYSPIQYWVPGADYKFSAFASLTSTQTVDRQWSFEKGDNAANGVIVFDNEAAEANQDLVYAYETLQTDASITAKPAPVGFTFNHMLSRVMFTITNGFTAGSNIKLDITNLTITNAHSNGRLAIENGEPKSWAVTANTFARNFGSTTKLADNNTSWTTEHFYLIPAQGDYEVTFKVTLWQAGVRVDEYAHTATVALNMGKGKSYNIKATLDASNTSEDGTEIYPIEFTVEAVEDWEDFGDEQLNNTIGGEVENMSLYSDAVADSTVTVKGAFNGGGNILAVEQGTEAFYANSMLTFLNLKYDGAVINNVTLDGNNASWVNPADSKSYGIRNINITAGGTYTIKNVESVEASYPLHVSTTAPVTLNVSNSKMEGWLSYNSATTATFTNVEFTKNATNGYARLRPYGTTVCENCNFEEGFVIDLKCLAAGKEITFKNCTVGGVALTESHLTDAAGKAYTIESFGGEVEDVTLTKDTVANSTVAVKGTFDGNGKTLAVEQGTEAFYANSMLTFLNLKYDGAVISNVTLDGNNASWTNADNGKSYGIRNINITKGGTYTINNVVSVEASYPLHVSTTDIVTLNVSNSTMEGWLSYNSGTTATFTNVKFTGNSTNGYARLRPYGTTVCDGCDFEAGFVIDLKYLAAGKTITFKNCKVGGAALTASHLTDAAGKTYIIE